MYESLRKHDKKFRDLHVLAMDKECYRTLRAFNDPSLQCSEVEYFEDRLKIKSVRKSRTWQEYCWTMASVYTNWLLPMFEQMTYVDADIMFFADPQVIFDEIEHRSIAVIPHRLIPSKKHLEVNGQFNVSLVHFKNTPAGRECLSKWAAQCIERCSAKVGCGDQGYLDEWPAEYGHEVAIIRNIGVGVAPWNLANYKLTEGPKVDGQDVVFYHYHEFKELKDSFRLTNYELRPEDETLIYSPYLAAYSRASAKIASVHISA